MPPLPVPVVDVVIWSQPTSVKDVQLQPTPVTTLNRPLTPACGALSVDGESVRLAGEPFSVRVKSWAGCEVTVIVPKRGSTQAFGLAVYVTVPLPVPVAVVGTAIQGVVVEAAQLQVVCTPNELVPPPGPMVAAAGCSVMVQTAAPCVTG